MGEPQDRLAALEQRMDHLQAELTELKARISPAPAPLVGPAPASPSTFDLTALLHPSEGLPAQEGSLSGEVLYAGVLEGAGRRMRIQRYQKLLAVLEASPEPLAQLFAALSSPHRIIILRVLCQGPRSSQSLQELLNMSSAGQLYHHLKELLAAGLIVQRGRRDYEIAPGQEILVCLVLTVAFHLMTGNPGKEEPLPNQKHLEDQEGG